MTAMPARADAPELSSLPDRRREQRHAIGVAGNLRTSDGGETSVRIAEISLHGCRVTAESEGLRTGMFVSVSLGDEPPLEAIVRWIRGGYAGMEFLWPIPPQNREWHTLADLSY